MKDKCQRGRGVVAFLVLEQSQEMEIACGTETFVPYLPDNSIYLNEDQALDEWMDGQSTSFCPLVAGLSEMRWRRLT